MQRIHLLQPWYDRGDPAMEVALIELPTMGRFAGIDRISSRISAESTILAFRHLLEKHGLGDQILEAVKAHLKLNGMAMKQGKKGNQRYRRCAFRVIRRQPGFQKTRLRGMIKNRCKMYISAAS